MEKCISNKPECRRSNGGLNGGGEEIMGQVAKHTLKTHSISPPFLQECFHHRRYRNSLLFYPLETHHAKLHFLLFLLLSLWVTSSSCFYTINSHLQLTHLCQHLASYIHLIFFNTALIFILICFLCKTKCRWKEKKLFSLLFLNLVEERTR